MRRCSLPLVRFEAYLGESNGNGRRRFGYTRCDARALTDRDGHALRASDGRASIRGDGETGGLHGKYRSCMKREPLLFILANYMRRNHEVSKTSNAHSTEVIKTLV